MGRKRGLKWTGRFNWSHGLRRYYHDSEQVLCLWNAFIHTKTCRIEFWHSDLTFVLKAPTLWTTSRTTWMGPGGGKDSPWNAGHPLTPFFWGPRVRPVMPPWPNWSTLSLPTTTLGWWSGTCPFPRAFSTQSPGTGRTKLANNHSSTPWKGWNLTTSEPSRCAWFKNAWNRSFISNGRRRCNHHCDMSMIYLLIQIIKDGKFEILSSIFRSSQSIPWRY